MREILFRGKRLDDGEWVYGYYVNVPCGRFERDEHLIQQIKGTGKFGARSAQEQDRPSTTT